MLGLSLSLGLGSYRSGGGAPVLTSSNGTTQGTVLTVSSGATLYRDGIAKTAPYTTTADDALATFWAQVGSTRSSTIVIASTATSQPLYTAFRLAWTNGRQYDGDAGCQIGDIRIKDTGGSAISLAAVNPVTTSYNVYLGALANLVDNDFNTQCGINGTLPVSFELNFAASSTIGSCEMKANNPVTMPADMVMYGKLASNGTWVNLNLASVWPGPYGTDTWGYSYDTWKSFPLAAAGLSISGTFSYASANITLAIAGASGTTKARVLDYSDTAYPIELADWATKSNGGTVSAVIQADYRLLVQDSAAPSAVVASALTIPVMGQSAPNATLGLNFNIMGSYYPGDEPRNLIDKCDIYWSTGGIASPGNPARAEVTLDIYGNPVGPIPSGMTTLVYHVFENSPNLGRHGAHTATILNGSGTLRFYNASNITTGSITATTAAFTVPSSGGTDLNIMVDNPTMPADGFKLLVTKDSDSLTYPTHALSPQAARDYEATQFGPRGLYLRDLHISGVEDVSIPANDFGYKSRPEFAARICNQTGGNWAHSSHWAETGAQRLDWVTRWKATASSIAILWGEYLNEVWNNVYSTQQAEVMTLGINAGFMPAYQPPVGVTVYTGNSWTDPTSGVLNRNVAAGTVFWCFTFQPGQTPVEYGYYRWTLTKCLTGASSGDTVPFSGTNSQWQTLVSNDATGFFTAMYRQQATTQKAIGTMGHAQLGARFKSVLGSTSNIYLQSVAALTDAVVLNDNYTEIDHYALNGYPDDLGYNTTTYPWMADLTNTAAVANGFFTDIPPIVDAFVAAMLARVDEQFASFIAAGIPANQCPRPVVYEFGMPRFLGIPQANKVDFAAAMNVVFADSRMTTLVSGWCTDLLTKFDIIIWHNTVQAITPNAAGSGNVEQQIYGALLEQQEVTPPRSTSAAAVSRVYLGILDAAPAV